MKVFIITYIGTKTNEGLYCYSYKYKPKMQNYFICLIRQTAQVYPKTARTNGVIIKNVKTITIKLNDSKHS